MAAARKMLKSILELKGLGAVSFLGSIVSFSLVCLADELILERGVVKSVRIYEGLQGVGDLHRLITRSIIPIRSWVTIHLTI
jgi:hypothetical protein